MKKNNPTYICFECGRGYDKPVVVCVHDFCSNKCFDAYGKREDKKYLVKGGHEWNKEDLNKYGNARCIKCRMKHDYYITIPKGQRGLASCQG